MELLQAGDRLGAENLLTRTSNANITKAGLKLEPMGGPGSTFSIGDVRFATNKQKLAQVDCRITEEIDGVSSSMDVVWQVRKRGIAWRISGVVLELDPDSAPDLLSFENPTDVAQMLSFASEEVLDETPTRQAEAPQAEEIK